MQQASIRYSRTLAKTVSDECCYEEGDVPVPDEQYDQTISW